MTTYAVTLTVTTDIQLTDDQARDVAARWAAAANLDLGMTSTSRGEPWLRVAGMIEAGALPVLPGSIVQAATDSLSTELRNVGATVHEWLAVEVLHSDELAQRARRPPIPPMVNATQLAELAGVTPVRIYQLESERAKGRRSDFPAPVLEGYWLRTMAEHWARTRRSKPGPAPAQHAED